MNILMGDNGPNFNINELDVAELRTNGFVNSDRGDRGLTAKIILVEEDPNVKHLLNGCIELVDCFCELGLLMNKSSEDRPSKELIKGVHFELKIYRELFEKFFRDPMYAQDCSEGVRCLESRCRYDRFRVFYSEE